MVLSFMSWKLLEDLDVALFTSVAEFVFSMRLFVLWARYIFVIAVVAVLRRRRVLVRALPGI